MGEHSVRVRICATSGLTASWNRPLGDNHVHLYVVHERINCLYCCLRIDDADDVRFPWQGGKRPIEIASAVAQPKIFGCRNRQVEREQYRA